MRRKPKAATTPKVRRKKSGQTTNLAELFAPLRGSGVKIERLPCSLRKIDL